LRPISAFVLDCGLSISEVNSILRIAAVHTARARQLDDSDRVNISGIAAITGIPRGEVSRILNSGGNLTIGAIERHQNVTSRILTAWHRDPRFLTSDHRPRGLKIFGSGPTLESLVRMHGQGIPIRAILDELRRVGAIQLLTSSQKILAKASVAIGPRITRKRIKCLDSAAMDLFSQLLSPGTDTFVERVSGGRVWSGPAPLVRTKSGANAIGLLGELQSKLTRKQAKRGRENTTKLAHLNITIVYMEAPAHLVKRSSKIRRNLRRKH
jgi:hypothetical protein